MMARERRTVIVGASACALLIAGLRILPAGARSMAERQESAEARIAALERTRGLIARRGDMRDSLERLLTEYVALAPRLLSGRTRADAAATLASWAAGSAVRHGLRLRRAESASDSSGGAIQRVTVRVQLEGDINGVTGFLGDIEAGTTLLTADDIALTALDPASPPSEREVLRLELAIQGWFLARVTP